MAKALVLTAITGAQLGRRHTLVNRVNTVGSGAANDLVLQDRRIDTRHAEIRQMLDRWFIVPVSPSGGISVNGRIITGQARLNPGDKVTLGAVTYEVAYEEVAELEVGAEQQAAQPRSGAVPRLGDYFVRRGLMTPEQVNATLKRQAEMQRSGVTGHFGQVAHELGFISRSQLDRALNEQRADFNDAWRD
ncbi:MAG TPA: FHA domain-containing protein [Roseiflexaceae bacterium]|nr:FHA domain-containing protein [Roseiflexaceae bacterium]